MLYDFLKDLVIFFRFLLSKKRFVGVGGFVGVYVGVYGVYGVYGGFVGVFAFFSD